MSLFFEEWGPILWQGFLETLTMTGITLVISLAIGLPLGVFLTLTRKGGQSENLVAYSILNWVINILRSLPFIILLFLMIPVTRFVVGTTIGIQGVIMPLVVFTAPYMPFWKWIAELWKLIKQWGFLHRKSSGVWLFAKLGLVSFLV
ncbi:D-methionine transport system permease protein metI [Listeria monocytogenes N53-1]|nr:D-methionine transport system permease protein metI [Listeria monocytogenes N53-1]